MSDLLTVQDLEAAKKHDTFHSEVITGKAGGVAGGASIDYATNAVTGQTQKTLPRTLLDIAFVRTGTFAAGATLTDMRQTLEYNGHEYSWAGTFPKVVAAGATPETSGGIGAGAWVDRTDLLLRTELNNAVIQRTLGNKSASDIIHDTTNRKTIYAVDYGVVDSRTVDSADALQAILTAYPTYEIILPQDFAISHSIKYPTLCNIRGISKQACVCWMLPGFTSDYNAAFEPLSAAYQGVINPSISNITFVDVSAVNDGTGSTSILNGVELLGTHAAELKNLKGVRINDVVHCGFGPGGVHQYTSRPKLSGLDGGQINHLFNFERTTDSYFPYGDIYCSDIFCTGSVKYGARAEDTDGFTWVGSTMFPDAQLRVSGNYITIAACHPFEAKVKLTDDSTDAGECFVIAERLNGQKSQHVNVSLSSAVSGRLSDGYAGGPLVNKVSNGVSMYEVEDFVVNYVINDPSGVGLYMRGCSCGVFNASILNANTQNTTPSTPIGTYDSVLMDFCTNVIGKLSDKSPAKRYAVYMGDGCCGCHVDVVSTKGTLPAPSNVKIPNDGQNTFTSLVEQATGAYKKFTSNEGTKSVRVESSNFPTPSAFGNRSGGIIRFDNTVVTNVSDLPEMEDYDEAILHIQDNGATRFVPVALGGKFVFIDGSTSVKLGRGTIIKVMRCPTTGYLVQF